MNKLACTSSINQYKYNKYEFLVSCGFAVNSNVLRALKGRLTSLIFQKLNMKPIYLGRAIERGPLDAYVDDLIESTSIIRHTVTNLENNKTHLIENLRLSIKLFTNPQIYSALILNKPIESVADNFHKSPFQQFLMLHFIITLISRSGFTEHRQNILAFFKEQLGITFLTPSKIQRLEERFSCRVGALAIPRRHGKTTALYSVIASSLCFFPQAHLHILYIIHTKDAAQSCFEFMVKAIPFLLDEYNKMQLDEFNIRKAIRNSEKNQGAEVVKHNDYYFYAYIIINVLIFLNF